MNYELDQAAALIDAISCDKDGPQTFQTYPDNKEDSKNPKRIAELTRVFHGRFSELSSALVSLNKCGAGIFLTINKTDLKGRKTKNIVSLRSGFADCDTGQMPPLKLKPSAEVQSKRGPQCYFFLENNEPMNLFSLMQTSLAHHLGTDSTVHDLPRVMRLPGFFHVKDPKDPFLVRLESLEGGKYRIDEILRVYPPPEEPSNAKVESGTKKKLYGIGERHAMFVDTAVAMRKQGKTIEEIRARLLERAEKDCDPPKVDPDEIDELLNKWIANEIKPETAINQILCGPYPLHRELPDPSPFPIDSLGNILAPAAKKMIECIQTPDSICGNSLLAAAALAVQAYRNIEIDGRVIPLSLNNLTIAESGDRKTAEDNEALKPHREHQKCLVEKYVRDFKDYQDELEAYLICRGAAAKGAKNKTQSEIRMLLRNAGDPPIKPLQPTFICEEPTYEGIVKLLSDGLPSVGLFSDEGGRMIGGHAMSQDNQIKTIAGLSSLWDGKPISRVRAGDGNSLIYGKRVSLHLMAQPMVALQLLGNPMIKDQGILARTLVCYPKSTAGSREYRTINLNSEKVIGLYRERISEIYKVPFPIVEGTRNELEPKRLVLSSDAKTLWTKYHDHIEKQLGDGKKLASIRGFGSKAGEHALRCAGVLATFHNLDCGEITITDMELGISLAEFYISETLRLSNHAQINPDLLLAAKLLQWAREREDEFIYLQEIYQYGPNSIREKEPAKKIVKILEDHNYLIRVEGGMKLNERHRREVWRVIR